MRRRDGNRDRVTEISSGDPERDTRGAETDSGPEEVQALLYENRIELIPVRPVKRMRGFLKGIDTTVVREGDRP